MQAEGPLRDGGPVVDAPGEGHTERPRPTTVAVQGAAVSGPTKRGGSTAPPAEEPTSRCDHRRVADRRRCRPPRSPGWGRRMRELRARDAQAPLGERVQARGAHGGRRRSRHRRGVGGRGGELARRRRHGGRRGGALLDRVGGAAHQGEHRHGRYRHLEAGTTRRRGSRPGTRPRWKGLARGRRRSWPLATTEDARPRHVPGGRQIEARARALALHDGLRQRHRRALVLARALVRDPPHGRPRRGAGGTRHRAGDRGHLPGPSADSTGDRGRGGAGRVCGWGMRSWRGHDPPLSSFGGVGMGLAGSAASPAGRTGADACGPQVRVHDHLRAARGRRRPRRRVARPRAARRRPARSAHPCADPLDLKPRRASTPARDCRFPDAAQPAGDPQVVRRAGGAAPVGPTSVGLLHGLGRRTVFGAGAPGARAERRGGGCEGARLDLACAP